jgi:hypothetical protein
MQEINLFSAIAEMRKLTAKSILLDLVLFYFTANNSKLFRIHNFQISFF